MKECRRRTEVCVSGVFRRNRQYGVGAVYMIPNPPSLHKSSYLVSGFIGVRSNCDRTGRVGGVVEL